MQGLESISVEENLDIELHLENIMYDGGRDWVRSPPARRPISKSWEEARKDSSLEPPEGTWLCWHLDFRFLASRTVPGQTSALFSCPVCGNLLATLGNNYTSLISTDCGQSWEVIFLGVSLWCRRRSTDHGIRARPGPSLHHESQKGRSSQRDLVRIRWDRKCECLSKHCWGWSEKRGKSGSDGGGDIQQIVDMICGYCMLWNQKKHTHTYSHIHLHTHTHSPCCSVKQEK